MDELAVMDVVDRAAQELQAALCARQLYSAGHQAARSRCEEAHALLDEALQHANRVTLMMFDGSVIFRDERLPSSPTLAVGLFERLSDLGAECLTFTQGVSTAEIERLLDVLADPGAGADALAREGHVRLGHVDDVAPASGSGGGGVVGPTAGGAAAGLRTIWQGLAAGRGCEPDLLARIVAGICETIEQDRGTILPLAELKEYDEYTFVHTLNVAMLSAALAEVVGLNADIVREITAAALLHDVGKRRIPSEILNKDGKLSHEEFAIVQRHPVDGAMILFDCPGVPELAPIVAFEHHMKRDGSGYPKAPPRWKLSEASQIVQVADVFDALRTNRPYRPAMPLARAVAIMREQAFDQDLVAVFLDRIVRITDRERGAE